RIGSDQRSPVHAPHARARSGTVRSAGLRRKRQHRGARNLDAICLGGRCRDFRRHDCTPFHAGMGADTFWSVTVTNSAWFDHVKGASSRSAPTSTLLDSMLHPALLVSHGKKYHDDTLG